MLVRSDAFELSRLLKSCPKDEREAGKVTLRDEIVIGLFEEDVLLGAAGGVRVGDLMDLSVIVAPSARKQGIACALLSHLCMLCADRELIPHYRYEAQNIASHQLRKKVGFKRAYSMTGAQAIYPAE
jgi:GNAT superfamily N-acetyltransferase